jgi:epoxyqueuosine reductase
MRPEVLRDHLIARARHHGFHRVGVTPVAPGQRAQMYRDWIAAGHHGDMAYLATPEHHAGRSDPRVVLSEARTIVVVALAYGKGVSAPPGELRGIIARYARGTDYHMVVRDKLAALAADIALALGRPVNTRICVDSAPLSERELAQAAGIGFVAKNTLLIAPGLGSYVVLGELLLDAEIAETEPLTKRGCGTCRSCLDACPTGAFVDAYVLDARRCISYLTIEYQGSIPVELRPRMGGMVFGCDICQDVCPYNTAAPNRHPPEPELTARDLDHAFPDLIALATAPSNQLRRFIKRTALRRAPRRTILRNVAIGLGNSRDPRAFPALVHLLAHSDALVRGHAAWALAELSVATGTDVSTALREAAERETDPSVIAELATAHARTNAPVLAT